MKRHAAIKHPDSLLAETVEAMKLSERSPEDVEWVGAVEWGWMTWDEFASLADFDYDSGFGAALVATDLVVVGNGWWMDRGEYDGSEWWNFHEPLVKPERHRVPERLHGGMWQTLAEQTLSDTQAREGHGSAD